MKTDVINLKLGKVDVLKLDDIIYFTVYGNFTDDDIDVVIKYTESFFAEINAPTIRIWDLVNITSEQYQLTPDGIARLAAWADKVKKKRLSNVVYIIGVQDFIFGMSRMYELKASDGIMPINVVKSVEDLPDEIKNRISKEER